MTDVNNLAEAYWQDKLAKFFPTGKMDDLQRELFRAGFRAALECEEVASCTRRLASDDKTCDFLFVSKVIDGVLLQGTTHSDTCRRCAILADFDRLLEGVKDAP